MSERTMDSTAQTTTADNIKSAPCSAGGSSHGSANGVASSTGTSPSQRPTSPNSRRPRVASGAPISRPTARTT